MALCTCTCELDTVVGFRQNRSGYEGQRKRLGSKKHHLNECPAGSKKRSPLPPPRRRPPERVKKLAKNQFGFISSGFIIHFFPLRGFICFGHVDSIFDRGLPLSPWKWVLFWPFRFQYSDRTECELNVVGTENKNWLNLNWSGILDHLSDTRIIRLILSIKTIFLFTYIVLS